MSGGTNADGVRTYLYFGQRDTGMSETGPGELARMVFVPSSGSTITDDYTYAHWDSAKQLSINKTIDGRVGGSTFSYNANGHLTQVYDRDAKRRLTYFNNAQGLVLARRECIEGKAAQYDTSFYYANGRRVGDVTNDPDQHTRVSYAEQLALDIKTPQQQRDKFKNFAPVTSADFDQNHAPINASYPAGVGSLYTVRSGDTLSSIAQSVWGDAAMWYLLADANGLSASQGLNEGTVLRVPNKVTNIHNNANTFRPYSPGEVIGNVDPTVPPPPPPPKKGCGVVGTLLMVAVAAVVSFYTAGALTGVATGSTQTMAAGMSVAIGDFGLAGIAYAAAGATAGSVASQLVGMTTGSVDKFSWKAVGQSALSAGITAGIGSAITAAVAKGASWLNPPSLRLCVRTGQPPRSCAQAWDLR